MKTTCDLTPLGWKCQRAPGHEGPCAAEKLTAKTIAAMSLDEYVQLRAELLHQAMVTRYEHGNVPLHPDRAPNVKLPLLPWLGVLLITVWLILLLAY